MTLFKCLRIIFLSIYWQLPNSKEVDLTVQAEVVTELNRKVVKRKRLKKKREKLPQVQRKVLGHRGFRKTRPKDPRFSDQRRLRRMFRGV